MWATHAASTVEYLRRGFFAIARDIESEGSLPSKVILVQPKDWRRDLLPKEPLWTCTFLPWRRSETNFWERSSFTLELVFCLLGLGWSGGPHTPHMRHICHPVPLPL